MIRPTLICLITLLTTIPVLQAAEKEEGWVNLFDGKSLKGWKANENKET